MSNWYYENQELTDDIIPPNAIAFLYMITHLPTGKWYIGRKNLYRKVTKNIKAKNGNQKKQRSRVESDWKTYWSSSEYLKELVKVEGESNFKREILIFVETPAATIYGEEAFLYMTGSMFDPLCINGHIRTKIMRKWFSTKESMLHERIKNCLANRSFNNVQHTETSL